MLEQPVPEQLHPMGRMHVDTELLFTIEESVLLILDDSQNCYYFHANLLSQTFKRVVFSNPTLYFSQILQNPI